MKSTVFLLISQPFGKDTPIGVTCAISGDGEGLRGDCGEFPSFADLGNALYAAGILESEMQVAFQVIKCGFPTFLKVGASAARHMLLLSTEHAANTYALSDEVRSLRRPESGSPDVG